MRPDMHLGRDRVLELAGALGAVDKIPVEELRWSFGLELAVFMVVEEGTVVTRITI